MKDTTCNANGAISMRCRIGCFANTDNGHMERFSKECVQVYKILSISSAKSLRSLSLAVMAKMSTLALKPCFSIGLLVS